MGNSKENREKLHLEHEDFSFLESESRKVMEIISGIFVLERISDESWPLRFFVLINQNKYEFIFSAMGSVAIRPAKNDNLHHNPAPIFYMSVTKYFPGKFEWEGPLESAISTNAPDIEKLISDSIANYELSLLPGS
ncbi:MAG: hypothetical protein K8R21_11095 [Leptospira sp.]|nr:hypothetical protein [Leptospira sp.]